MKALQILFSILAVLLATSVSLAQDERYGNTPEQQLKCKEALSVYKSYVKQKNYDEAYIQWRKACSTCPENAAEGLYYYGAKLVAKELKKVDPADARHATLVDSLMFLYDKRMELFPTTKRSPNNRCEVLEQKAKDYYKYFKEKHYDAYDMFKESLSCLKEESSVTTLYKYYTSSLYVMTKVLDGDTTAQAEWRANMYTDYLMLTDYAQANIDAAKANGDEPTAQKYEKAFKPINQVFDAIADCKTMIPVLENLYEQSPSDTKVLTSILRLLEKVECKNNDLFLPVATNVFVIEPSADAAYKIGIGFLKANELDSSMTYMEEAVNRCGDCSEKTNYLLKTGQVASAMGRTVTARNYARQVLELDSENADAYLLIGDAIAGSKKACDDGALGHRSVYWVASDYYARAKQMNPELTEKASKKMANMAKQFPTVDDIFTYGKQAGGSFTVPDKPGCPCSGETTTIRVR